MVNGPRDPFGRPQWPDRAYSADHPPPPPTLDVSNRLHPELQEFSPQQADRPMEILKALNEHCKIPASQVFLAIVDHHGQTKTYSSPNLKEDVPKFFHEKRWAQYASGQAGRGGPAAERELGFEEYQRHISSRGLVTRRRTRSIATDNGFQHPRKMRGSASRRGVNSDEDASGKISASKKPIEIGNKAAIWDFYDQRFKNIQQTACKQIAKAWVRLIAPKKQSIHPYTGKEERQPDWWPKPWGPNKDDRVRHKEPDHLYRGERVHLLCHILRLIMQPTDKQHVDFQKLNLSVEKLKDAAYESLSVWFKDKEHPNNGLKRPYLKEIFYVAQYEEKYMRGECDATTHVYIMSDNKIPTQGGESEVEDGAHEEEDMERTAGRSAISSASLSPARTSSQALASGIAHETSGLPYISEVQHRTVPYQTQILTSGLPADAHGHGHGYNMEGSGIGVAGATLHPQSASMSSAPDMYTPSQTSSRRPSMFASPTDFTPGSTPAMYSSWQGTTGPNATSPIYVGAPQQVPSTQAHNQIHHTQGHPHTQAQGQGPFVSQPGVAMPQPPSFMTVGSGFDDINRGHYDGQHDQMFRVNNVPSNPVHSQAFPMNLPHDGRDLRDMPEPAGSLKPDRHSFQH